MTKQQSYTGPRPDVISMIRKVPTRVLDVGCSNGNLGPAGRVEDHKLRSEWDLSRPRPCLISLAKAIRWSRMF